MSKIRALALGFICLFAFGLAEAKPRFPFPSTPDQTGQNDRDLSDDIIHLQTFLSSATFNPANFMLCFDSPTFCVNASLHVVTQASTTMNGSFTLNGSMTDTGSISSVGQIYSTTGGLRGDMNGGSDHLDLNGLTSGPVNIRMSAFGTSTNAARIRGYLNAAGTNTELAFLAGGSTVAYINSGNFFALNTRGAQGFVLYVTSATSLATSGIGFGADNNKGQLFTNGANTSFEITLNGSAIPFAITKAGEVTQPLQPSFLAINGSAIANLTGDATDSQAIPWATEVYDQNADFLTSTFTAPVDGKYLLSASISLSGILVTHTVRRMQIVTSNRTYAQTVNYLLAQTTFGQNLSVVAEMEAGDTATVHISVDGSTKVVGVEGNSDKNFFSGTLVN